MSKSTRSLTGLNWLFLGRKCVRFPKTNVLIKITAIVAFLLASFFLSTIPSHAEQSFKEKIDPEDRPTQTIQLIPLLKDYVKSFVNFDLQTKEFLLREQEKIFIFFAAYCSYCEAEIPKLNAIFDSLSRCNIQLIGVNMDEDLAKAKQVGSAWNIRFPYFYDEKRKLAKFLKVRRIPHFVFTDSRGSIVFDTSKIRRGQEFIKQKLDTCNLQPASGS